MFDKKVLKCFLDNQLQLFPEEVASTEDEAAEFLEEMFAVVVKGKKEFLEYFDFLLHKMFRTWVKRFLW